MATLADKSGSAGSNLVQGTGTSSATFSMPGSVALDVESVVATIDNTAGGATTPTLVVRDSSGEVIATKRMGDTIPAGDTGTATFSLRNSADGGSGDGIQFDVDNIGGYLEIDANSQHASVIGGVLAAWNIALRGLTIGIGAEGAFAIMRLFSENLFQVLAGILVISSDTNASLDAAQDFNISGDFVQVTAGASGMFFSSGAGVDVDMSSGTGPMTVKLGNGGRLRVRDHTGAETFQVRDDGSIHGRAAVGAITWDL